jgi:hypothetical protein
MDPKGLVTIGKETHHAILDLGSSVFVLSKELYELLELKNIEKCSIDLILADDSIKHALGKVSNVMVELHMSFVPVNFIIMDMENKTSSPIILGRPFLRTKGAIIDSKEGNVKFQFPYKSVWNTSQGRGTRRNTSSLLSFTHLNYQVSKPSYMAIMKALYGRQPGCFCFDFLYVLFL